MVQINEISYYTGPLQLITAKASQLFFLPPLLLQSILHMAVIWSLHTSFFPKPVQCYHFTLDKDQNPQHVYKALNDTAPACLNMVSYALIYVAFFCSSNIL